MPDRFWPERRVFGHDDVWYGQDTVNETSVMLKFYDREAWSDSAANKRTQLEVGTLKEFAGRFPALFSHVLEFVANDQDQYVLVLQRGQTTLLDHLVKQRVFSETVARVAAFQILTIIRAIHNDSKVHRDIQPGNFIVLNTNDLRTIKLFDVSVIEGELGFNHCHGLAGTKRYSAPEMGRKPYGKAVDLWSLGVIAYTLLMGRHPFEDEAATPTSSTSLSAPKPLDRLRKVAASVAHHASGTGGGSGTTTTPTASANHGSSSTGSGGTSGMARAFTSMRQVTQQVQKHIRAADGDSTTALKALSFDHPLSGVPVTAGAQDWIRSLLQVDPKLRPTAQQAMEHPYMVDLTRQGALTYPLAVDIPGFPDWKELTALDGRIYYYDHASNMASWSHPRHEVALHPDDLAKAKTVSRSSKPRSGDRGREHSGVRSSGHASRGSSAERRQTRAGLSREERDARAARRSPPSPRATDANEAPSAAAAASSSAAAPRRARVRFGGPDQPDAVVVIGHASGTGSPATSTASSSPRTTPDASPNATPAATNGAAGSRLAAAVRAAQRAARDSPPSEARSILPAASDAAGASTPAPAPAPAPPRRKRVPPPVPPHDAPPASAPPERPRQVSSVIPGLPDWRQCQNADGSVHYYNVRTGVSTWESPLDARPASRTATAADPSPSRAAPSLHSTKPLPPPVPSRRDAPPAPAPAPLRVATTDLLTSPSDPRRVASAGTAAAAAGAGAHPSWPDRIDSATATPASSGSVPPSAASSSGRAAAPAAPPPPPASSRSRGGPATLAAAGRRPTHFTSLTADHPPDQAVLQH